VGEGRAPSITPARFPSPLHSFRTVGFPQYGWKTAFAEVSLPLNGFAQLHLMRARSDLFQGSGSLRRQSPYSLAGRVDVCRPTGPLLSTVCHTRTYKRYYGLMRQSDGLRPVYGLSQGGLCPCGPSASPSLLCLDSRFVHMPRPLPRRTDWLLVMVHPPVLRAFTLSCKSSADRIPQTGFSGVRLTRRQSSLNFAACALARAPDQSPPFSRGHARLLQSLPGRRSPSSQVCYHYSAQPPIAEAGFSPARVSKNEGCTRS